MTRSVGTALSDITVLAWFVGGTVVVAIVMLAVRYLSDRYLTRRVRRSVAATLTPDNVALHHKPILTEAEGKFLRSLEMAVEGEYLVWPQLPIWTFIEIFSNDPGVKSVMTNRINLKRVDFVLVDRETHAVKKVVELDESSHLRADHRHRDAFVEMVLIQAGIPLTRIPTAKSYDPQALRTQLGIDEPPMRAKKSA